MTKLSVEVIKGMELRKGTFVLAIILEIQANSVRYFKYNKLVAMVAV